MKEQMTSYMAKIVVLDAMNLAENVSGIKQNLDGTFTSGENYNDPYANMEGMEGLDAEIGEDAFKDEDEDEEKEKEKKIEGIDIKANGDKDGDGSVSLVESKGDEEENSIARTDMSGDSAKSLQKK